MPEGVGRLCDACEGRSVSRILACLCLMASVMSGSVVAAPTFDSILVSPDPATEEDALAVTVVLGSSGNVTSVRFTYRQDLVSLPIEMAPAGNNSYVHTFPEGQFRAGNLTLHFYADFTVNGSAEAVEDEIIVLVLAGHVPPPDGDGNGSPGFEAAAVSSAVAVAAALSGASHRRRRG